MILNDLTDHSSVRCTIEYRTSITDCRAVPYTVRDIHSLLLIELPDHIDYTDKWSDRSHFVPLSALCEEGQEPLLVRDGLLTDTTYSNIVIETNGQYLTPSCPLLTGTRRQYYLDLGLIQTTNLCIQDCLRADCIHLINAMMPLGVLVISPKDVIVIEQKK